MAFRYPFSITMSSVDHAGLLFFPEIFRHLQDAYEAWLESLGVNLGELIRAGEYVTPVVHAEADYLAPLRHGERVTLWVRGVELGESSFTITSEVTGAAGDLRARLRSVQVAVAQDTGRTIPIPAPLREVLQAYRSSAGP